MIEIKAIYATYKKFQSNKLVVDHEIFGLQVPINDALLVQISEGLQGACGAKSGRPVLEGAHLSQHPVQFAAQVRVHQHVHPRLVLERPVAEMGLNWIEKLFELKIVT